MFIGKTTAVFYIVIAVVLLLAQCSLSNVIPTHVPENTKTTTTTEEITETPSTGDQMEYNRHHKHEIKSTEGESSESSEEYSSEESAKEDSNEQFKDIVVNDAFSNESLSFIKMFLKNVITEVVAYDDTNTTEFILEIVDFDKFLIKLNNLQKDDNAGLIDLLSQIASVLDFINRRGDDENEIFHKVFKKYNIESIISELHVFANNFLKTFRSKVYEVWQKLPADEDGSKKDFKKWYKDFLKYKGIFLWGFVFDDTE